MNWYPQIGAGAVAQYPLQRKRKWRAITNTLESGELISLPDGTGGQVEWQLSYQELTDAEVARLTSLFASCGGEANSFGFVDPLANLAGWSEDLSRPDWQRGLITLTAGLSDPVGTQRAWHLQNNTATEQRLSQALGVPGEYTVCFSAYLRGDTAGTVSLMRDAARVDFVVGPQWKRIYWSGTGVSGVTGSAFSLSLPAGSSVRVFGLQVEVQPWPSPYRPTGAASGILEETRFGAGNLSIANTAPGLSACALTLISRI